MVVRWSICFFKPTFYKWEVSPKKAYGFYIKNSQRVLLMTEPHVGPLAGRGTLDGPSHSLPLEGNLDAFSGGASDMV